MDDALLTPKEAAERSARNGLPLSARTLRRWAETGKIPHVRLPSGHFRIPASAVDACASAVDPEPTEATA